MVLYYIMYDMIHNIFYIIDICYKINIYNLCIIQNYTTDVRGSSILINIIYLRGYIRLFDNIRD